MKNTTKMGRAEKVVRIVTDIIVAVHVAVAVIGVFGY